MGDRVLTESEPVARPGWTFDWPLLLALFLFGLLVRVVVAAYGGPISHDAAMFYLPNARVLVDQGFSAWPQMNINVPFLFPTLVALVHPIFGDLEVSAIAISAAAAALMVVPVYGLARYFVPGDRTVHRFAALIACVQPFSIRYGADARGDALFALLFTVALGLALRILRRPAPGTALSFGGVLGLAYLVRPEALGIAPLLALATILQLELRRRRAQPWLPHARAIAAAGLLAVVALVPLVALNMVVVHEKIGVWTLSPKAAALQDFDKGLGDTLSTLNEARTMTLHEEHLAAPGKLDGYSPVELWLENPAPMLAAYGNNLWEFIKTFPEALGYCNWILCLVGLFCLRGKIRPGSWAIIGTVFAFYGGVLSTFYISRRFWLWLIPLAIPICAGGAATIAATVHKRRGSGPRWLVVLIMVGMVAEASRRSFERGSGWFSTPERRLAERLVEGWGVGQTFVSSKGRVVFYAAGVNLPLPSNDLGDIVVYMENRGARFLIFDRARLSRASRRPQLVADLDQSDRFELVAKEAGGGRQLECHQWVPGG